ncbi:ankyrin repeat domain-containing protein SOWAHB, partial [Elysia marginata]
SDADSIDGGGMSRMKVDEAMEVRMRHTDRLQPSASSSIASLVSTDSQMSTTSATSGRTSTDDDNNMSVISVKDKIKNLNKITSETDLGRPARAENNQASHQKKWTRPPGDDEDDASHTSSASYVTLNAEQKEWMVVCSSAEYHEMNRLLSKNPGLAKLKGYTALHLAAIHGHEHIIELLVQTFRADANLRDYSGKKAKQYLKNSASSKAQLQRLPSFKMAGARTYKELLVSRRLGSDLHPIKSLDDSFIRSTSMRMSNRAKAISSLMQANSVVARQSLMRASWAGSNDDMREDSRERPSKSVESSPASGRKNGSDMDLMPPPSSGMLARHMRHSERAKSSSRDGLHVSPRNRAKNDENQNFPRVESDTELRNKQGSFV